eukprot:5455206-Karenia_brevis.AAC.1
MLPSPVIALAEASYVDDVVVPLVADAPALLDRVAAAVAVVVDVFRVHCLTVNFSKGKTEVLCCFSGPGAKLQARKLHHDLQNKIPINFDDGSTSILRCISQYKHVGSQTTFAGADCVEICHRAAILKSESGKLCKRIFRSGLSDARKCIIVQAHLLSKGFYHAGTWATLHSKLYAKIHHA